MRSTPEQSRSTEVTALFADRALSFALPQGATLEDLAARLGRLGGRRLATVTVKLLS